MITSKAARRKNGRQWIVCLGACCASVLFVNSHAQQPTELIIRNGLIVTADGRLEGDLRIRGETIAEIGRSLAAGVGAREIDARGMLVVPGGVDPHTHLVPELLNIVRRE
jgi:N-acyl-D-aspartate/D-glutamate deacylase